MKYDIDNQSRLSKAFQVRDQGLQVVKPGRKVTFDLRDDLSEMQIAQHARQDVAVERHVEPAPQQDIDKLTVEELKSLLTDRDVTFDTNAKKADLIALAKG